MNQNIKIGRLFFILSLLFFTWKTIRAEQLVFPFLRPEFQSNIVVTADFGHSKPCSEKYTNLFSNTNLFSIQEQMRIAEVAQKYLNVTTNSGPAGTVFKRWGLRQMKYSKLTGETNPFLVACFAYTNFTAQEEIGTRNNSIIAKFRTQNGDGYNVTFKNNFLVTYREFKRGKSDGLFVLAHDPIYPYPDEHCGMWAHFSSGRAVGKFIVWQRSPPHDLIEIREEIKVTERTEFRIVAEAEFKEPFNFLKYQSIPIDLSWIDTPTIQNK